MKKILAILLIFRMISSSYADCNWSTGITKQNENYLYSKECHLEVGKLVKTKQNLEQANKERKLQIENLEKSIKLKDLALDLSDKRAMKWRDESYNQYERLMKKDSFSQYSRWIWFGGGIGFAFLSVWAAGQLK